MSAIEPGQAGTATTAADARDDGWLTAHTGAAGYRTDVRVRAHTFVADEPASVGGADGGPTPYDYLLGALAACTTMTLRMYANRKGWPLEDAVVRLRDARSHAADCENCEKQAVGIRRIERQIELKGSLTDEQRQRLLAIAERCPIKQTLERGLRIESATPPSEVNS
jgi:putative redox protein